VVLQNLEVFAQVEARAEPAPGAFEGLAHRIRVQGLHAAPERGRAAALLVRKGDAPADFQMGDQTGQVQLRLGVDLHPQGGEFGALVLLMLRQQQAKVIGAGGRNGWPGLGRGGGWRDFAGHLGQRPLEDPTLGGGNEHIGRVGRVVEDPDLAAPQFAGNEVPGAVHHHGAPLPVNGAGLLDPQVFLHDLQGWSRAPGGRPLTEPFRRALPCLGMDVAVVGLGEPGLEPGVQLLEGGRSRPQAHLVLELLTQGPVEPFYDTPTLRHVGRGMNQVDPQGGAARTEAEAPIGRAVI